MTTPNRERLLRLRGILAALSELDKISPESLNLEETVEIGHILWKLIQQANKHFTGIKARLRNTALAMTENAPGVAHMDGTDHAQATVTIPNPEFVVRKDADPEDIETALGGAEKVLFLFDIRTTFKPRREFENKLPTLTDAQREKLLNLMDLKSPTPRVSFK